MRFLKADPWVILFGSCAALVFVIAAWLNKIAQNKKKTYTSKCSLRSFQMYIHIFI